MKTRHHVSHVASLLAMLCVAAAGVASAAPQDDLVVLESQQEVVEASRTPLRCGAVGAAEAIAAMLEGATTAETMLPGQVAYGSTFLSRMAYNYRWSQKLLESGRNIAVFEYLAQAGRKGYLILESQIFVGHAERRIAAALGPAGVEAASVTAIYSELSPCTSHANCAAFIAREFPNAVVTFSFEYAATEAARKAAVAALKKVVASCR